MGISLRDLHEQAQKEGLSDFSGDRWEPKDGETYNVTANMIRSSLTKNELPRWGVMFRIVDGDDAGKTFWDNWNLTEQYPKIDARTFHYLELIGLTIDRLEQQLSDEQLSEFVVSNRKVIKVSAKYKQDKNDPTKLWADHKYEAGEGAGSVVSAPSDNSIDDDFDF